MPDKFQRTYIGLGSNLQNPVLQLQKAQAALEKLPLSRLACVSSFYRSAPLGPPGQPHYINAVAALDTALAPLALLDALQRIENIQGRLRGQRWGARTLDLDILLFGGQIIDNDRLSVPHPQMPKRAFVLWPLAEIAPNLTLPDGQSLTDWLAACPFDGLERLPRSSPASGKGEAPEAMMLLNDCSSD